MEIIEITVEETVETTKGRWEGSHYIPKGVTGYWSKWGGGIKTPYKNQFSPVEESWRCQSCGKEMPKEISPFLYEYPEKEYIRVCPICLFTNCDTLKQRLK